MTAVFDRRRIQAPESSYTPAFESSQAEAGPSRRSRIEDEARSIFLKTSLISQANGSGYIESGRVKIACSVYGPRPRQPPYSPLGSLNLEVKFAPFASDPRRAPMRDTEPAPLSALLTAHLLPALQLHLFPKSVIDVHLLVLESDLPTNVLATGLTVASAAIADAGIPMYALGVGTTESWQTGGGESAVALGVLPAIGKLSGIWLSGEVDVDSACDMIAQGVTSAKLTHGALAQALIDGARERSEV